MITLIPAAAIVVTIALGLAMGAMFLAANNLGVPAHRANCIPSINQSNWMFDLESAGCQTNTPSS